MILAVSDVLVREGADRLGELCQELESAARVHDAPAAKARTRPLHREHRDDVRYLEAEAERGTRPRS